MSTAQKLANLAGVVFPLLATVVAIVLLWNTAVGVGDLVILGVMYTITALSITIGFHRMLTHRAFQTKRWVRYLLAVTGTMAVQGPVISWVADHRKHHAHTDQAGDPHTPHGHGDGISGMIRGLWHAHMGWLFERHGEADWKRYAPELYEDAGMRWITRNFVLIIGLGLAIPAAAGFVIGGPGGALTGLLWGGFVRVFLLDHVTWSINSVCHFLGTRPFETNDESRNVFWLSLLSFGESWHNNHHAFPRSAANGMRWYEVDVSSIVIRAMERVGLAWNVVRISPERQRERRLAETV